MSSNVIKLIAALLMAFSHAGNVLGGFLPDEVARLLIILGRPVFPVFAFFLAEGWEHTRSKKKYLLRLGIFALVSQLPFAVGLFSSSPVYAAPLSVIATLFFSAVGMYLLDRGQTEKLWLLAVILPVAAAYLTKSDYGALGVLTVLGGYVVKDKRVRPAVIGLGMAFVYMAKGFTVWTVGCLLSSLLGVAALYLYNGRREGAIRTGRYFFYWFYPLHLSLLIIIRYILGGQLI